MFRFLGEILIPLRNLHHQVARAIGHALAAQARLRGKPRRFVELIEFSVGRFVARLQPFVHDDVARGARADAAAGVVQTHVESRGDIKDAAGQPIVPVGNFFRIHLDRFAFAAQTSP